MARLPIPLRLLLLAGVASASPAIFLRNDKCTAEGLQSCASQGLSDAFCCAKDSICISLSGGSTVMCCPKDKSCSAILPITCDVNAQDPTTSMKSPIKTLALNSTLPKCAKNTMCCPFGYSCADDGKMCTKDADQSRLPEGYTPPTTTTSTAVQKATDSQQASATASAEGSQDQGSSVGPEKMSIIGGVVGGILVLMLLSALIFFYLRGRRRDGPASSSSSSYAGSVSSSKGLHGKEISAPIPNEETIRTDFGRRSPSTFSSIRHSMASTIAARDERTMHRKSNLSIPNRFGSPSPYLPGHSPAIARFSTASNDDFHARTGKVAGARVPAIRDMKTNRYSQTAQPERGSERIDVFADAYTAETANSGSGPHHDNRTTSVGALMKEAAKPNGSRRHVPGTTPRI
ncbi:hypothetical protein QQS21_001562 [Conoideocrella luteorostrata]|uniref:Mid2 domain-containing protein n=1 Tax=Conoideocrella luteorostrata TaxID=1105319 RepID=A0AAJ0CZX1_9HYPO|nr:hypothetical protein QQS21_001562 [Conoideocrella luteorostrata]